MGNALGKLPEGLKWIAAGERGTPVCRQRRQTGVPSEQLYETELVSC